jgi:hypothetical protein
MGAQAGHEAHRGSAIDARLQTAVSSFDVYSTISVHRFEHLIVPRFCWLLLRLHESLKSMYGLPVSTCASRIANQSFWLGIVFMPRPSRSYLRRCRILTWRACKRMLVLS